MYTKTTKMQNKSLSFQFYNMVYEMDFVLEKHFLGFSKNECILHSNLAGLMVMVNYNNYKVL